MIVEKFLAESSHYEWYLEGHNAQGDYWEIPLYNFPFRVGRLRENELCLTITGVSRRHAEIIHHEGDLWIKECGSTNGTFINRQRINGQSRIVEGDIIHIGPAEFRLCSQSMSWPDENTQALAQTSPGFVSNLDALGLDTAHANRMADLLRSSAISFKFQPIFDLPNQRLAAYELLGRGDYPGLPKSPFDLFNIAGAMGRAAELSELFRVAGVQQALALQLDKPLFINTAPEEFDHAHLAPTLTELRKQCPDLPLVLEIHEKALTSLKAIRELQALLKNLQIELAYDDFGAGQARLVELIQVPPDWLKFDIALIRNIHLQPPRAIQVLATLVKMARDINIKTLAEGIEVDPEQEICLAVGFDYGQGYLFGRPNSKLLI